MVDLLCMKPSTPGRSEGKPPLAFHITMRLVRDGAIARHPGELRRAARLIYKHGTPRGLLAFRIADTHVHVLAQATRQQAGALAQAVQSALKQALHLDSPFERARYRAIESERHLFNALRYVFRQEEHHGTRFDPAHDGSSLPELLGMRMLDRDVAAQRLGSLLPRLSREALATVAGALELEQVKPHTSLLAEAAAAALGITELGGDRPGASWRRAAVHAGKELEVTQLASMLGASRRTIRRLRTTQVSASVLHAVEQQWRLRTALFVALRQLGSLDGERTETD